MTTISRATLQRAIDHVFLPPKLPQEEDTDSELELPAIILSAVEELAAQHSSQYSDDILKRAAAMLQSVCSISRGNGIDGIALQASLETVAVGHTIAIKVAAQNAAILVTRGLEDFIFECFELSPPNESVMGTQGRLRCTMPTKGVSVPAHTVNSADFITAISTTIATMSTQPVTAFQRKAFKSGAQHVEDRDTADPTIVSGLLFAILSGSGAPAETTAITKHIRDEVLWNDTRRPWRRSPMWLLIRVALQLVVQRSGGTRDTYKSIMVWIMGWLLRHAKDVSMETVYIMECKISRRLSKLPLDYNAVTEALHKSLTDSHKELQTRWQAVQKKEKEQQRIDRQALKKLDLEADSYIALHELDKHLSTKAQHRTGDKPVFQATTKLITFVAGQWPSLKFQGCNQSELLANLHRFELWVEKELVDAKAPSSTKHSYQLLQDYQTIASRQYKGNPEAWSVMILTAWSLFVLCDRAAVRECLLLAKYSPGMPIGVLQSLLLPTKRQMLQLSHVEQYISSRKADFDHKQLFQMSGRDTFAVRYFDDSAEHQQLLASITQAGQRARDEKLQEFADKKAKYERLRAEARSRTHEYRTVVDDNFCDPPETHEVHISGCVLCRLERQYEDIFIEFHEWPISRQQDIAKTTVFELAVPAPYAHWRDCRSFLLQDVLGGKSQGAVTRSQYSLHSDPHLGGRFSNVSSRVGLLSETKPAISTHYRRKHIAGVTSEQMCVANGLRYGYCNKGAGTYIGGVGFDSKSETACTYKTSVNALNRYLSRPATLPDGPSPNTVIACQHEAPEHMTTEEFKDLATVPLGHHIHWHNIALQLVSPSVDLKHPDTSLVFWQCMYQAGPTDRSSHDSLKDNSLVDSLLQGVRDGIQRLCANWNSATAFGLFATITARILDFTKLKQRCLDILAEIRKITFGWMQMLNNKADEASSDADRTTFTTKAVYIALICSTTFDVDDEYLAALLNPANLSTLLQVVITIHDGGQTQDDAVAKLMRWRLPRMMHRAVTAMTIWSTGLYDALKCSWAAFETNSKGGSGRKPWITTTTASGSLVHLNLFDGRLLVDGASLSQAPPSYRNHALWQPLFGAAVVKVMPASVAGFELSTKRTFGGYSVQLGLAGPEFAVHAQNGKEVLQLLPNKLFHGRLPTHFSEDFIYWYSMASGTIAVRPKTTPWSSNDQWTLTKRGNVWQMHQNHRRLVGLGCPTSRTVHSVLQSLITEKDTFIFFSPGLKEAQIDIPSLRLSFRLLPGSDRLWSKDHALMYIDKNQDIGCLIGLQNKLVLKNADSDRLVLILDGNIGYDTLGDHMVVTASKVNAKVQAYAVDKLLGRLVDRGGLRPKLLLAYLHAVTSSCLPDPLTCKTGTESALSSLESAAVFSMQQMSSDDSKLLSRIASLSPDRGFYPTYLKEMQSVKWDPHLPSLSQHNWLSTKAERIVEHYRRQHSIFKYDAIGALPRDHPHLHDRDGIRTSTFRRPDFGAEDFTVRGDQDYVSRCCSEYPHSAEVAILSKQIHTKQTCAPQGALWQKFVDAKSSAQGPIMSIPPWQLTYDASLLSKKRDYVMHSLLPLFRTIERNRVKQEFAITIFLATLRFSGADSADLLKMLVTYTNCRALRRVRKPVAEEFIAARGYIATLASIINTIKSHSYTMEKSSHTPLTRRRNEHSKSYGDRCRLAWETESRNAVQSFAENIFGQWSTAVQTLVQRMSGQWPTGVPARPKNFDHLKKFIDVEAAMSEVQTSFRQWADNRLVRDYLNELDMVMPSGEPKVVVLPTFLTAIASPSSKVRAVSAGSMLSGSVGVLSGPTLSGLLRALHSLLMPGHEAGSPSQSVDKLTIGQESRSHESLDTLINILDQQADSAYARGYAEDLRSSFAALQKQQDGRPINLKSAAAGIILSEHLASCKKLMNTSYQLLASALRTESISEAVIGRMPQVSPRFFLQQLSQHNWSKLSMEWKQALIDYGLAIAAFQQATRLVKSRSTAELINRGHSWDPMKRPEALLLEIESDILIRDVQADVATAMLSPACNSTLQLNMGEGKSSVIVPIIAIDVANAAQIPTVIVGKPQSKQMADTLRTKVSGLVDRRLYFMPFSRWLDLKELDIKVVLSTLEECKKQGGVLILQPEHLLSLMHMPAENHLENKPKAGLLLASVQAFLDSHSRLIVDECDEVFSPKFELVYSIGQQHTIDGGSSRWTLLQEVMSIIRAKLPSLVEQLGEHIEVKPGVKGSFPRTRLLREEAADTLVRILATHICQHGVESLSLAQQKQNVRDDIFTYLTERHISAEAKSTVEEGSFWTNSTQRVLLLLRGLLAGGILGFVLTSKRWRVQYGPRPGTRLAVPYHAKDSPSLRSEFSHPDVVILLTSLSYYYEGLSDDDLFSSLNLLWNSDEPDAEYALWTKDAEMPPEFMQIQGINLKDRPQCLERVFPPLRYSKGAIDYFLNKLVFPKEMKEFPSKLSASGWDIGKIKNCLTTGFSGTSDSQHLLPLMVKHVRLPESAHTDALVLDHILQSGSTQLMDSVEAILGLDVQVVLDVGAQVEEDSKAFAIGWLLKTKMEAVVFVDQSDVICVADRHGHVEPLQSSPFITRLSACLVFLDEAHTRGIDLKLPVNYRAAVTLGARLTKDRLVQACMRMRQLGKGQTVVFCIPEEIQRKLPSLDVQGVLLWTMAETRIDIHRSVPLWAGQGERYFKQAKLWEQCTPMTKALAIRFLENESQTIEQRYQYGSRINIDHAEIAARCREFENLDFNAVGLQEEQERELAVEIEAERQIQRPAAATPYKHEMHASVEAFARTGVPDLTALRTAWKSLSTISAAKAFLPRLKGKLLVSSDFANTVVMKGVSDNYQRSVQWILLGRVYALVISPYEANALYPQMKHTKSTLHLFKARVNVSHPSLDDLSFCSVGQEQAIPRQLAVEIALFAGQLYITTFEDYKLVCGMLGLATDSSGVVDADGFIREDAQGRVGGASGLPQSPVAFVQSLLSTVRRNGEAISRTHMGRVLRGRLLSEEDFRMS